MEGNDTGVWQKLSSRTCGGRIVFDLRVQRSLYFKTTHGNKKMWCYMAGGVKIKVIQHADWQFGTKSSSFIIKGGLKIKGCKIEGTL